MAYRGQSVPETDKEGSYPSANSLLPRPRPPSTMESYKEGSYASANSLLPRPGPPTPSTPSTGTKSAVSLACAKEPSDIVEVSNNSCSWTNIYQTPAEPAFAPQLVADQELPTQQISASETNGCVTLDEELQRGAPHIRFCSGHHGTPELHRASPNRLQDHLELEGRLLALEREIADSRKHSIVSKTLSHAHHFRVHLPHWHHRKRLEESTIVMESTDYVSSVMTTSAVALCRVDQAQNTREAVTALAWALLSLLLAVSEFVFLIALGVSLSWGRCFDSQDCKLGMACIQVVPGLEYESTAELLPPTCEDCYHLVGGAWGGGGEPFPHLLASTQPEYEYGVKKANASAVCMR